MEEQHGENDRWKMEVAAREKVIAEKQQEIEQLQRELHEQKLANEKAPTNTMKRLGLLSLYRLENISWKQILFWLDLIITNFMLIL